MALRRVIVVATLVAAIGAPAAGAPPVPTSLRAADSEIASEIPDLDCDDPLLREAVRSVEADLARRLERRSAAETRRTTMTVTHEDVLEVARDIDPTMARRLRRLHDERPDTFQRALHESARRIVALAELRNREPQLYQIKLRELKMDQHVRRVARQLAEARANGSDETPVLEAELRRQVMLQIALSIKARVEYLQRLQEHVRALEEKIDEDAARFQDTVEERIRLILESVGDVSAPPALASDELR